MTTQTPTTTGESQVIRVFSTFGGAFGEKLKKVNRKLAKQGLGACKVLGCEMVKIPVLIDGEESTVSGYCYSVQIPFVSKKIEGHTLIGTVEELGKGQRMLSPVCTALADEPVFPQTERMNALDKIVYETDCSREDYREYRELRAAYDEWHRTTIQPLYEAQKEANGAKLETLRHAANFGCVHCNTVRARKSVLVFEKENGELVTIGRACSKEYFGVDLAAALSVSNDLNMTDEERCSGGARSFSSDAYRRQFGMVYWLVKNFGYVSPKVEDSYTNQIGFVPQDTLLATRKSTRTMVYEMEQRIYDIQNVSREDFLRATDPSAEVRGLLVAEMALAMEANYPRYLALKPLLNLNEQKGFDFTGNTTEWNYTINYLRYLYLNEEEFEQALVDCTNFWLGVESTDTFMQNCKAVAVAEVNKSVGMTGMVVLKWMESITEVQKGAFFVPAHRRMFPKEPAQAYLAPVGKMVDVTLTVTRKMMGGYDDSPWFMVIGRTAENLEAKLFCKVDLFNEAKEGEELRLRAKVKSHDVYKGSWGTSLYYAKVVD